MGHAVRRIFGSAALALVALASAPTAAIPPAPPPPIMSATAAAKTERSPSLLMWTPGPAQCADVGAIAGPPLRRPYNALVWSTPRNVHPVALQFSIDASGRTKSIRYMGDSPGSLFEDIAPALAASSFAPGAAHPDCIVTYVPRVTALSEAPVADLVSYTVGPHSQRLPEDGWKRIAAEGDCGGSSRPQPLLQAFPAFHAIPATPGVRDWTLVRYDIDRAGKPRHATIAASTGNGSLEEASIRAIAKSRFTKGPRTGCVYPFWRAPAILPAPPIAAKQEFPDEGEACKADLRWANAPRLTYPPAYQRRSIEGWAVVRFDVAPWGEIGDVEVLAAEPTEDFGKQAVAVIKSARMKRSTTGATGCIDRIRFRITPTTGENAGRGGASQPS